MPLLLIRGRFTPGIGVPDGDTCRFSPDDPDLVFLLKQGPKPPKYNPNNRTVPLRYEAIDAMEKTAKKKFAGAALAKNLELLGVTAATSEPRGYVLARQLDQNGRPVAFVFRGDPPEVDGSDVELDVNRLRDSVNYQLLVADCVYPMFYDTLFFDLRDELRQATKVRRNGGGGIWAEDATTSGISWTGKSSLDDMPPIFPKLWRRLQDYCNHKEYAATSSSLQHFKEYLTFEKSDRLLRLVNSQATGFDNIMEIGFASVRMTDLPEDIVFKS